MKLKQCPKCGYKEPLIWNSYRWITDMDQARFDDFQKEKAYEKWKDLEPGQIVSDDCNYYRRTCARNGGCFVQKWPKVYGPDYYKSRFFERFKAKRYAPYPGQQRLSVEVVSK